MDTKKKPTKEDIEYAKKRLAEAKQNAANYDEQVIRDKKERLLEEKNKPYIPPKDRKKNIAPATALEKSSFEDIKIRSSSSDLPINKGIKLKAEEVEKIEAVKVEPEAEADEIIIVKDMGLREIEAKTMGIIEGEKGLEKGEKGRKDRYEKRKPVDPKIQLVKITSLLLKTEPTKYKDVEMEIKFGTRGIKRITKTDYDNVIKKLSSLGFKTVNPEGTYTLKIQPEFLDMKSGMFKIARDFDRLRVEINGINNIQEYCKNGNIQKMLESTIPNIIFIMKKWML
jgi:hypothetical protein